MVKKIEDPVNSALEEPDIFEEMLGDTESKEDIMHWQEEKQKKKAKPGDADSEETQEITASSNSGSAQKKEKEPEKEDKEEDAEDEQEEEPEEEEGEEEEDNSDEEEKDPEPEDSREKSKEEKDEEESEEDGKDSEEDADEEDSEEDSDDELEDKEEDTEESNDDSDAEDEADDESSEEEESDEKLEDAEADNDEENAEESEEEESEEDDSEEDADAEDSEEDKAEEDTTEAGTEEEGTEKDLDLDENAGRDEIKKEILQKSAEESQKAKPKMACAIPLTFLSDKEEGNMFIGRKKSIWKKYGYEAAMHVGRVAEDEHFNSNLFMDSLNPHVVFVCGARGSGKSYVLGVMAEELAKKNKNVGIIAVDPIGVFWSMRFPNKEEREVKMLSDWGLLPEGLDNLRVFIPEGMKKEVPKSTYDETFSIQPSLLTGEDWCLTFGIDRFSPTGLLLELAIKKVEKGYKDKEGKKIKAKRKNYSLPDLTDCLESDEEIHSKEKGYKPDSIRALVSRFGAANNWGIFSEKGTPLGKLSRENQLTILDTSFLDDSVTALVVGVLARRILAARKISTRKEAAQRIKTIDVDKLLEIDIPPTWLFIDEAHTLIPGGNQKTPASHSLIEYVKQGRRPGCSLVFATQQPSSIDSKVLSQLDFIITHKLVFDDDVKAVFKRTPAIIPAKYKKTNFVKTLPVGVALVGDRAEETSRAFVMRIRPRLSQHEGRDAETTQSGSFFEKGEAEKVIFEMIKRKIEKEHDLPRKEINELVDTLNIRYKANASIEQIIESLNEQGFVIGNSSVSIKGYNQKAMADELEKEINGDEDEESEEDEEADENFEDDKSDEEEDTEDLDEPIEPNEDGEIQKTELVAFPRKVKEKELKQIIDRHRKRKTFGILGKEERISDAVLKYRTIWKMELDTYLKKNQFTTNSAFVDAVTGEFIHFDKGKFIESTGLTLMGKMRNTEARVLRNLEKKGKKLKEIAVPANMDSSEAKKILEKFVAKNLVKKSVNEFKVEKYWLRKEIDLPPNPNAKLLDSVARLPFVQAQSLPKERENYPKDDVIKILNIFWPNVLVKKVEEINWPIYHITLEMEGKERTIMIDGLLGQRIQ